MFFHKIMDKIVSIPVIDIRNTSTLIENSIVTVRLETSVGLVFKERKEGTGTVLSANV